MDDRLYKEGDLYEIVTIEDHRFEIRYGYYDDRERERWEPTPIYPDFTVDPLYSKDGYPLVTRTQDPCSFYRVLLEPGGGWCADCIFYPSKHQSIGICCCEQRKKV